MASYDPRSDKIYGCKKDSLVWWHERGHQILFKSGITSEKDVMITFMILIGWAFLTLEKNLYSRWALFFVCFLIFAEEIYCWIYGLIKYYSPKT